MTNLTNLSPTDGLEAWYEERFHVVKVNFPIDPNLRAAYAAGRQSAAQEIERLTKERDRLREALEQIADLAEQGEHTSGAAPIARAALEEKP